jgi:hypothetical protein
LPCPRRSRGKAISAIFCNSWFLTGRQVSGGAGRSIYLTRKKKTLENKFFWWFRVFLPIHGDPNFFMFVIQPSFAIIHC